MRWTRKRFASGGTTIERDKKHFTSGVTILRCRETAMPFDANAFTTGDDLDGAGDERVASDVKIFSSDVKSFFWKRIQDSLERIVDAVKRIDDSLDAKRLRVQA